MRKTIVIFSALILSVSVVASAAITDLSARAKATKVQLVWTHQGPGSSYNVFRRQVPGTSSTLIGTTESVYSTFLDQAVAVGNTYCYQVSYTGNLSNEACVTVEARRRR